jgi:hypothetical protein
VLPPELTAALHDAAQEIVAAAGLALA